MKLLFQKDKSVEQGLERFIQNDKIKGQGEIRLCHHNRKDTIKGILKKKNCQGLQT